MANYLYGAGQLGLNALTNLAAKSGSGILGLSALGKAPTEDVVRGMKGFEERNTYDLRDDGKATAQALADLYGDLPQGARDAIEYVPKKYQEYTDRVGEVSPTGGAAMAILPAAIGSLPMFAGPNRVAQAIPTKGLANSQRGVVRAYSPGKESLSMEKRYDRAVDMYMSGKYTPEEIADKTGWFYDTHSQNYLTMTPTNTVKLKGDPSKGTQSKKKFSEIYENPELQKTVDISRLMQMDHPKDMPGTEASVLIDRYDPRTSNISLRTDGTTLNSPVSLAQHEVGHAVHAMQGLGEGSNPKLFRDLGLGENEAWSRYENVWGEAMARLGAHPELQGKSFRDLQKMRLWDPENFKKYSGSDYKNLEYIPMGEQPTLKKR